MQNLDRLQKRFRWNTPYSSSDRVLSDHLWDKILPSHGFISVDRQWAVQHQWPVTGYLPSDHSKGVYLLEAYHQMHCLVRSPPSVKTHYYRLTTSQKILRKTFWEAVEGRNYTYHPGSHMDHCFDTLRQVRFLPPLSIWSKKG